MLESTLDGLRILASENVETSSSMLRNRNCVFFPSDFASSRIERAITDKGDVANTCCLFESRKRQI